MRASIKVTASPENLLSIEEFSSKVMLKANISTNVCRSILICIDEIFSNITNYGNTDDNNMIWVDFCISVNEEKNIIKIKFKDNAIKFDPTKLSDPDITLSAEERKLGGLGFYIVKHIMDDVKYKYEDNCNCLELKKLI